MLYHFSFSQIDKETQQALGTLVDTARHYVTPNNQFDLKLKWSEPAGISSVAHRDYLTQLGNLFYEQVIFLALLS